MEDIKELERKFKDFEKRHQERIKLSDEKQAESLKFLNNILRNVLDQIESNTEKFYEVVGEMQVKYFETLEKQSARFMGLLEAKKNFTEPPLDETPKKLDDFNRNDISKEELRDDPLSEENRVPIVSGLKVQFEGEEIIHPVNIE